MASLAWRFDERELRYVKEVLDSGFASGTSGSMNGRLERAFAERFGVRHAITFNSGTTTLHAALWALGVRPGDEVITTPLTVISCMNAILYCQAIPVFADVDPDTFLMDPDDVERKITDRTRALLPVHLYGQVCDMDRIMDIARRHGLGVVEDCAQCFLGTYRGRIAGTIGDVGSWSFENSKHLTTGDGGIVGCNDTELARRIRCVATQGFRNATADSGRVRLDREIFQDPSYKRHSAFGFMYRLPEVAAAVGLGQLEKLDWFSEKRQQMASMYRRVIEQCPLFVPQKAWPGERHAYWTYAVRFVAQDMAWKDFRRAYVDNGGDGIYAAWTLSYLEDSIPDVRDYLRRLGLEERFQTQPGVCPNAERIQPQLMQFTTNQSDEAAMAAQVRALEATIAQFTEARGRAEVQPSGSGGR
ncbi:MAG: DegT/DnrJ/EryC1/StrS family aminotransferase [Candidatus Eisenbacteria bacterium]|nr:DegT/DnrJ/EryC1/StrS family aminotransferase [Candidatus Eisenbacteria bacterium]